MYYKFVIKTNDIISLQICNEKAPTIVRASTLGKKIKPSVGLESY